MTSAMCCTRDPSNARIAFRWRSLDFKGLSCSTSPFSCRTSGNYLLDFWLGTQLNPTAFGVDLKWFCLRLGMLGWLILNMAVAAKQLTIQPQLSHAMILYQVQTAASGNTRQAVWPPISFLLSWPSSILSNGACEQVFRFPASPLHVLASCAFPLAGAVSLLRSRLLLARGEHDVDVGHHRRVLRVHACIRGSSMDPLHLLHAGACLWPYRKHCRAQLCRRE